MDNSIKTFLKKNEGTGSLNLSPRFFDSWELAM